MKARGWKTAELTLHGMLKLVATLLLLVAGCSDDCEAVRQEYADLYERAFWLDAHNYNATSEVHRLNMLWATHKECLTE